MSEKPLITLDPKGKAPIISYNIPEPTSYVGRNFIELDFPSNYFMSSATKLGQRIGNRNPALIKAAVANALKKGMFDSSFFGRVRLSSDKIKKLKKTSSSTKKSADTSASEATLFGLDASTVESALRSGKQFRVYKKMSGKYSYAFSKKTSKPTPRLMIVERYRLSTYLGNYGAGKTIKTFSLLPGEHTSISVKTYKKSESSYKQASSILDSYTEECADEFEISLQEEQSESEAKTKSHEYYADADVEATWSWGKASVSGGYKGSTNTSREEFSKSMTSAVQKHSTKASSQRDVEINTSYEVKEEEGIETSTERVIKNINVSRTLNFVFRQMNQEFITFLHLTDVRIAYFNGYPGSKKEVPLSQLDELIKQVILPAKRNEVKQTILNELHTIFDYQDKTHSFIEQVTLKDKNNNPVKAYWRVKKEYVHEYNDPATGSAFLIPGIILSAKKNVMRTEGVIVEALLGHGDALDSYAHGLQDEKVRQKVLDNQMNELLIKREELAQRLVHTKNEEAANIFETVFASTQEEEDD